MKSYLIVTKTLILCALQLTFSLPPTPSKIQDFNFTQPLYYGNVQERVFSVAVKTKVMMGMWLSDVTRNVRFSVIENGDRFRARKKVVGNFVFLDLYATSLTQSYDVHVQATVPDFSLTTFCVVHVEVTDINDMRPLFPFTDYSVAIPEDTELGTIIITVKATDSDRNIENKRIYYSLPTTNSGYFAVHSTTGDVTLTAPLNADAQSVHSVQIQARDRKAALRGITYYKSTTLTVTVEKINAHPPVMILRDPLSYENNLFKNGTMRLHSILQITDADSGLQGRVGIPRVLHTDIPGIVSIEQRKNSNEYGIWLVKHKEALSMSTFNVVIEVADLGRPAKSSKLSIPIKFFDESALFPIFSKSVFQFTVSEFSPIHTQVGFVDAVLPYSDIRYPIHYSIIRGNELNYFTIHQNTSLLTTSRRLCRNEAKTFSLTVAAINSEAEKDIINTTTVNIIVEDANDHDPIFVQENYSVIVSENTSVGAAILTVSALDEDEGMNGVVVYSMLHTRSVPFNINSFNGTIYTTTALDAFVPGQSQFLLRIRARDSGSPFSRKSECSVTVQITNANDNAPEFNSVDCVVSVPQDTPAHAKIIQLEAIDIDGNPVTCFNNTLNSAIFEVDASTCSMHLNSDLGVGFIGDRFVVEVVASDGLHTSKPMEITINVIASGDIEEKCRDSGAIFRFEEAVNKKLLRNHNSDIRIQPRPINRTSFIPNKHRPSVLPRTLEDTVKVREDVKLGSELYRIRAYDRDKGYNGKLWFTIVSGNKDSCFSVNSQTGVVFLVRFLDRELISKYVITIKVSDLSSRPKSTLLRLRFDLLDVNDNPPIFDRKIYSIELPEDIFIGYHLKAGISASDADDGDNGMIRFNILPSIHSSDFSIDVETGIITVSKPLDREMFPLYNLTVIATDSSPSNPLSTCTNVIIRLTDVNDNAPRFHKDVYRVRIAEDIPINTVVFWLQAFDPDLGENGEIRYTLIDGVADGNHPSEPQFRVDDRTGVVRLQSSLDSRFRSRYNLTARARDLRKLYSSCYIEIEVIPVNKNIHAPYFLSRHIRMEIIENFHIGTEIGSVLAIDEDITEPESTVHYYISDGNGFGLFDIEQNAGIISNRKVLDREMQRYYWLTVVAQDCAPYPLSGLVFVLIEILDANDNAPETELPFYIFNLPESSQQKNFVGQLHATDRDSEENGAVFYNMKTNPYFDIDPETGIISTKKRRFAWKSMDANNLFFEVSVADSGSPDLSSLVCVRINITNNSDNSPQFLPFLDKKIILVKPNKTQIPREITRVVASVNDENSDVLYTLNSPQFRIDSDSGVISLVEQLEEDRRSVLKITAENTVMRSLSTKFRLEIEWRNYPSWTQHPPVFVNDEDDKNFYHEHVNSLYASERRSQTDRIIRQLRASDLDSKKLWFKIIDGNEDDMFDINADNILYVAGNPDAETKIFYNLTVEVSDGHNRAIKNISLNIVDVNDHRPMFVNFTVTVVIDENVPPNSHVTSLLVNDGDATEINRNFIFRIRGSVNPSSMDKFRITSDGDLYTLAALDREVQKEHVLLVEVNDQGVPASLQDLCRVRILILDKNEFRPSFSSSVFFGSIRLEDVDHQFDFNTSKDFIVLKVQASDGDVGRNAKILYSIVSGKESRFWKINEETGEITATEYLWENRNKYKGHLSNFTVMARDCADEPFYSTTEVSIKILKEDEDTLLIEAEVVKVNVLENLPPGRFITNVEVTGTYSVTYDITGGNEDGKFSINPYSGVISLNDKLDREKDSIYNLTVTVISAEGKKIEAYVIVCVEDFNDNKPKFKFSSYTGFVTGLTLYSPKLFVLNEHDQPLKVEATDPDEGNNGKVRYRIADATEETMQRFSLDSYTGIITTKAGLNIFNHNHQNKYRIKVQAVDLGSPQLSSEAFAVITIHVRIKSWNLHFLQSQFNFSLHLPVVEGFLLSRQLRASSSGLLGFETKPLTYSLSDENPNSLFEVDSKTGYLYIKNPRQIQSAHEYQFNILATDGNQYSQAKIVIQTFNLEQSPEFSFSNNQYYARVVENSTQPQRLVAVHMNNINMDKYFRYAILNPHPGFVIGFTSGVISTTGVPLDRESKSVYKFLIEASDISSSKVQRARCVLQVQIEDINDNHPLFFKSVYKSIVQVNAKQGSVVGKVQARDADFGMNAAISYYIEENSQFLHINEKTGVISLRQAFYLDTKNFSFDLNVTVIARDMGRPALDTRAVFSVSFVDQVIPVFPQEFYGSIGVSEDAQPYTIITDVIKASTLSNKTLYYTIEDGDENNEFDIDPMEGTLRTLGKFDREKKSFYRLRIRARTAETNTYSDIEVEVKIEDANDNWPMFSEPFYKVQVLENHPVGSIITRVKAIDSDIGVNGKIEYLIINRDKHPEYFSVNSITGEIWITRELNFETKQLHTLIIRASDGGIPTRYTEIFVVIDVKDVNDNAPIFEDLNYEFGIKENSRPGSLAGKVSAWDADLSSRNSLKYFLDSSLVSDIVDIDSNSGILTLRNQLHLQFHNFTTNFTATVSDGLFLTSTRIILHILPEKINDLLVSFENLSYFFQIVENKPKDTAVGMVRAFGSGILNYQLATNSLLADFFRVNARTGQIFTSLKVDREEVSKLLGESDHAVIEFELTATNSKGVVATCNIRIEILDENDNRPVFALERYSAVLVPGMTGIGDLILNVTANDQDYGDNGLISYRWDDDTRNIVQNILYLNESTGSITVARDFASIDTSEPLHFFVEAFDHGLTPKSDLVSVSLYFSSSSSRIPKFGKTSYFISVAENIDIGSGVATVQAVVDQGQLQYFLEQVYKEEDNDEGEEYPNSLPFAIDISSGQITTNGSLDYETKTVYDLRVFARVRYEPAVFVAYTKVIVYVIDVNDNDPQCSRDIYRVSMLDNSPIGSDVITIHADDRDRDFRNIIFYRLNSSSSIFRINRFSGLISLTGILDWESYQHHELSVLATDGNDSQAQNTATCQVVVDVIDINDNPPTFSQKNYDFKLKTSVSLGYTTSKIIEVNDKDKDGLDETLIYIISSYPKGYFSLIVDRNGRSKIQVGLQVARELNRKFHPFANLTLLATDGIYNSTASVHISVEDDVHDSDPFCQQLFYSKRIAENISPGSFILRLNTLHAGSGKSERATHHLSGEYSHWFDLDGTTGDLTTSVQLDRELTSQHRLLATSQNENGFSCSAEILIFVEDANDNEPEFVEFSLRVAVYEDLQVGSIVHQLIGRDPDLGENGSFLFSYTNIHGGQFFVEPITGAVILKKPLDRERKSSYLIPVQITDRGKVRLSSEASLQIQVLDVNDNPPVFEETYYLFEVNEDIPVGDVVARITARSLDIGENAQLHYTIARGNEHGKFEIDHYTGNLILASTLDYEAEKNYILMISASDRSNNPLSSECTVKLKVLDANDNPPQFTSKSHQVSLLEDTPIGYIFYAVKAIDQDAGGDGNVTYHLKSPNVPFKVNSNNGKISISVPGLDYEQESSYSLAVSAVDHGQPPLTSETTIDIEVVDINDNRPRAFVSALPASNSDTVTCSSDGANCTVFVKDNSQTSVIQGIIKLNASDEDSDSNSGPFTYRIKNGNDNDLFYLDGSNILKTRKSLKLLSSSSTTSQKLYRLIYCLTIEVEDSGSPQHLKSDPNLELNIVVVKANKRPPIFIPYHIDIILPPKSFEFPGGLIAKRLNATGFDLSAGEQVRFFLASPNDFEQFLIEPSTGALTATSPISSGVHEIPIRVSDGYAESISKISVNVTQLSIYSLKSSVSIIFLDIGSKEKYLNMYHSHLLNKLEDMMPNGFEPKRDFLTISLQENGDKIEILFCIQKPPSINQSGKQFYMSRSLRNILERNKILIEERMRVEIHSINGLDCSSDYCEHGKCQQFPYLEFLHFDQINMSIITTTSSYSLINARFQRNKTCICPTKKTDSNCRSICTGNHDPCTKEQNCFQDSSEKTGYRCDSLNRSNDVISFNGQSTAEFLNVRPASSVYFACSFSLKTFQSNSFIIVITGSTHSLKLATVDGFLNFTFSCGERPQSLVQNQKQVNDGRWYDIEIKAVTETCSFEMAIDDGNDKFITAVKTFSKKENFDLARITIGGESTRTAPDQGARRKNEESNMNSKISYGFIGCIQNLQLNDNVVSLESKSKFLLQYNRNVTSRCRNSVIDMGACSSNSCMNGGKCEILSDGMHQCDCPMKYSGEECEELNLCGTIPCKNNARCSSEGNVYKCHCAVGFSGGKCENVETCQCQNGGTCATDSRGRIFCKCKNEWTGPNCEIGVNVCATSPAQKRCGGRANCFNFRGGYACNCTKSKDFRDRSCEFVIERVDDYNHSTEKDKSSLLVLIIAAVSGSIVFFIVIIIIVLCWKRKKDYRRKYSSGSRPSQDISPVGHLSPSRMFQNQPTPPRIPQRPLQYHRSQANDIPTFQMGLNNQEQRFPVVGLVRPQIPLSSFSALASSENSSIYKPPFSLQDNERTRLNGSASPSFYPSRRSSANTDQQGSYHRTGIDRNQREGMFFPPSFTSSSQEIEVIRRGSAMPSSPESHHSFASSSATKRSHCSQKSDALSGHYNVGRKRRQKQLLQMIALKEKNEQENLEIQKVLSHLVNQELQDDICEGMESQHSSLRSSLSRYQQSINSCEMHGEPSYVSSSLSQIELNKRLPSSSIGAEIQPRYINTQRNISHNLPLSSDKKPNSDSSSSATGLEFFSPLTDFELQTLKEEEEELNLASSSLPYKRGSSRSSSSSAFLYQISSNMSLASDRPSKNYKRTDSPSFHSLQFQERKKLNGRRKSNFTHFPRPPQRLDSENLPLSSMSEDEEVKFLQPSFDKHVSARSRAPAERKSKTRRVKKRSEVTKI